MLGSKAPFLKLFAKEQHRCQAQKLIHLNITNKEMIGNHILMLSLRRNLKQNKLLQQSTKKDYSEQTVCPSINALVELFYLEE